MPKKDLKATTINLHNDLLEIVNEITEVKKITRTQIINYCLRKFVKEKSKYIRFYKLTTFQPSPKIINSLINQRFDRSNDTKTDKEKYHRFHISISTIEYEEYFDLKKSMKLSFSFIVCLALLNFMKELMVMESAEETINEVCDKYRLKDYHITIKSSKNTKQFTYTWKRE